MKIAIIKFFLLSILLCQSLGGAHAEHLNAQQLELYLKRLNLDRHEIDGQRNLALLEKLLKANLRSIPFENLNMHTSPPVPILNDIETLSAKILMHSQGNNRGGYCYEVNELFFHLLKTLRFKVQRHKASVWPDREPHNLPNPSHQLLTVKIENEQYLADVAFGVFTLYQAVKLPLEPGDSNQFVDSRGKRIKLEKVIFDQSFGEQQCGQEGFIYSRFSEFKKSFERISTFTLQTYEAKDYLAHNDYVQNKYNTFLNNILHVRFDNDGKMIACLAQKTMFKNTNDIVLWINDEDQKQEQLSIK